MDFVEKALLGTALASVCIILGLLVHIVICELFESPPEWTCECVEIEATSNDDLGTIKQTCMQRLCTRAKRGEP